MFFEELREALGQISPIAVVVDAWRRREVRRHVGSAITDAVSKIWNEWEERAGPALDAGGPCAKGDAEVVLEKLVDGRDIER